MTTYLMVAYGGPTAIAAPTINVIGYGWSWKVVTAAMTILVFNGMAEHVHGVRSSAESSSGFSGSVSMKP